MSRLTILLVIAAAYKVLGDGVKRDFKDSRAAPSGLIGYSDGLGCYGLGVPAVGITVPEIKGNGRRSLVGSGIGNIGGGNSGLLNNAAVIEAAQLSAILNAQAVQVTQIANAAAATIRNAIQNAQAAAYENARAIEAARRAAAAVADEVARAVEAERAANDARNQAVAIATARPVEAARIANAARAQAAAMARNAQGGAILVGGIGNGPGRGGLIAGGPVAVGPVAVGPGQYALRGGYGGYGLGGGYGGYGSYGEKRNN